MIYLLLLVAAVQVSTRSTVIVARATVAQTCTLNSTEAQCAGAADRTPTVKEEPLTAEEEALAAREAAPAANGPVPTAKPPTRRRRLIFDF